MTGVVMETFELSKIRLDGGTQPRTEIDHGVVADYADALASGVKFPPLVVFYDGADYWLADGFHRLHAHQSAGIKQCDCDVRQGTRRDAVLFSVGANAAHGLRRTNADKRRAVETLLRDPEWNRWSDREIARRCAVDHVMVGKCRRSLVTVTSEHAARDPESRTFTTKHGTEATMRTENIGSRQQSPEPDEPVARAEPQNERQRASRELDAKVRNMREQGASNADIARALGVCASTISNSVYRQGLVKKAHPIQSVERRARETAEDLLSFMGQPELYLDGADEEDRELCRKSLRDLQAAVSKAINWLKKEANEGR